MVQNSKKIKTITRSYSHYKHFRRHVKKPGVTSIIVNNPKLLLEAKRLHAEVYLRKGFIEPNNLDSKGTISILADPHQSHAKYFVAVNSGEEDNNHILATARQINYKPEFGFDSFPVLSQAKVYPGILREIKSMDPKAYVEISALVKHPSASIVAPFVIYKEMLKHSERQKHKRWIMALDITVYKHLRSFFGDSVEPIGEITPYPGGDVLPTRLRLENILANAKHQLETSGMISGLYKKAIFEVFTHDQSYEYELEGNDPSFSRSKDSENS